MTDFTDIEGDSAGFAVAPALEAFSDFAAVSSVTGPLGTIGCAREKCASSSFTLGFEVLACCGLCLENFPPDEAADACLLLVISDSSNGVDSGLVGSTNIMLSKQM